MMQVTVYVDATQALADLAALKANVPFIMASMGIEAGNAIANTWIPAVIRETPVDTGNLKVSVHANVEASPRQTLVEVHADAQNPRNGHYYGQYVVHGFRMTFFGRPNEIYPPNDFPQRAFESVLPVLPAIANTAAANAVRVMRIY